MTFQEDIYRQVEEYIQGSLHQPDNERIKNLIDTDPVYRDAYEEISLSNRIIVGASFSRLREKMRTDLNRIEQQRTRRKKDIRNISMAALLIGAGIAGIWIGKPDEKTKEPAMGEYSDSSHTPNKVQAAPETIPVDTSTKASRMFPVKQAKNPVEPIVSHPVSGHVHTDSTPSAEDAGEAAMKEAIVDNHLPLRDTIVQPVTKSNRKPDPRTGPACDSIKARFTISPSCSGENTGRIEITEIKGGLMPYVVYIDDIDISYSFEAEALRPGSYIARIYDANQCEGIQKVTVPAKSCQSEQAYSFSPDFGETWTIPRGSGETGVFKIIGRSGHVIYEHPFGAQSRNEWTGIDKTGKIVDYGMYICLLEYSDGRIQKIQVTVIR